MCNKTKILASVKNGELSVCNGCNVYSLTFNNILFQFEKEQLLQFRNYIGNIDVEYWLHLYSSTNRKRQIPVSTLNQNLTLLFNESEIEELKLLLSLKENNIESLSASQIDYKLVLN
mgnify:FL=1